MSTIKQSRDEVLKEYCYAKEKKKEALRKIEESEQIMAKEETKVKNLVLEVKAHDIAMQACDAKIAAIDNQNNPKVRFYNCTIKRNQSQRLCA